MNSVRLLCKTVSLNRSFVANYVKSQKILRGRYYKKRLDGTRYEYNESITVIPKEFEDQDEYKYEKAEQKRYQERYERQKQERFKRLSLHLEPESEHHCEETKLIAQKATNDQPVTGLQDPYKEPMKQCIFCKHNVPLDYKNAQLLSQFISPQTGLVYRQEITGLCLYKYDQLERAVNQARKAGLMPYFYIEKTYINNPSIFDPFTDNLKKIPSNYDKRDLEKEQG